MSAALNRREFLTAGAAGAGAVLLAGQFARAAIGILIVLATASFAVADSQVYDIRDFDARAGGESLCTKAIQDAIDKCAGSGGGTVFLPPGKWLTGTIYLESNVTMQLDAGCTLLGSKDKADYGFYCRHVENLRFQNIRLATSAPDYRHAVVFDDVHNAAIDALDAPFAQNVIPSEAEESTKTTPQSGSTTQTATTPNAAALVRIIDSAQVIIRNCRPKSGTDIFLDLTGPKSKDILLVANDLSKTKETYRKAPDVPDSALTLTANRLPQE